MNSTTTGTSGAPDTITLLLINAAINIVTLLINAHQSYRQREVESNCCGKELLSVKTSKTKFSAEV